MGSGIAIACCLTAYLLIAYNIEFDSYQDDKKVKNIYAVHTHKKRSESKVVIENGAPFLFAPLAMQDFAGIKRFTRYVKKNGSVSTEDKALNENIAFADKTIFEMFDFPLVKGSHESFNEISSAIINEDIAFKYFGDEDPIGQVFNVKLENDTELQVVVGGVIANVPNNSSVEFNILMRIENYEKIDRVKITELTWKDWREPTTYLELMPETDPRQFEKNFEPYVKTRNHFRKVAVVDSYHLSQFKEYTSQDDTQSSYANVRVSSMPLIVFSVMAFMILLIACFNLTNTSIAIIAKRLKEVGVRKVLGASKFQILIQFLLETIITMSFSILVGLTMASYIVPVFADMWGIRYGLEDLNGVNLLVTLFIILMLASSLAGSYPGLFTMNFNPVKLLKGKIKIVGISFLTRTLTSVQFAISVMVLISGVVFIQNTKFQEQIDFGYDMDAVISISANGDAEIEQFINKVSANPKIISIGRSRDQMGGNSMTRDVNHDTTKMETRLVRVGPNFLKTIGLEMIKGKQFLSNKTSDQNNEVIVNQAFIERSGIQDPIGTKIHLNNRDRKIVGIVQNHLDNLYFGTESMPFAYIPTGDDAYKFILVRTSPDNILAMDKYLEEAWNELFPNVEFQSLTQEEMLLGVMRRTNNNMRNIFLFLTLLGVLLSVSGIFALATLNIDKRSKEIGVRKTLGASTSQIINLLNREFIIIMLTAAVFGGIGGFFLIDLLLDQIYLLHIEVSLYPVILCALFVVVVGLSTTSFTLYKAAQMNPVLKLRDE